MPDYRNLFANTPAPDAPVSSAEIAKKLFDHCPSPAVAPAPPHTPSAPSCIATPQGVQHRYNELVSENEVLMHKIIDLTQSVKQREHQLDTQFKRAQQQAQELQEVMLPKRSLLGRRAEPDKNRAHQLVDELQHFMRCQLKPDMFLYKDIDALVEQSDYLARLIQILKSDAEAVLSPQDPLLERIVTQAHLLSLQACSTRQLNQQLNQQLQDIDQWRHHSLSLLVIDIQQKL